MTPMGRRTTNQDTDGLPEEEEEELPPFDIFKTFLSTSRMVKALESLPWTGEDRKDLRSLVRQMQL